MTGSTWWEGGPSDGLGQDYSEFSPAGKAHLSFHPLQDSLVPAKVSEPQSAIPFHNNPSRCSIMWGQIGAEVQPCGWSTFTYAKTLDNPCKVEKKVLGRLGGSVG